jgi:hypothetical protein
MFSHPTGSNYSTFKSICFTTTSAATTTITIIINFIFPATGLAVIAERAISFAFATTAATTTAVTTTSATTTTVSHIFNRIYFHFLSFHYAVFGVKAFRTSPHFIISQIEC